MKMILDILDSSNCCGCGACINACPTGALVYSSDRYGFFRPQIDESKCISCGKCSGVCPEYNELAKAFPIEVYAALNKNEKVLIKSASGGVFYALAEKVISEGGCVFGATLDASFEVRHICIENRDDLPLLQKSKYVQSFIGDSYKNALKKLKNGQNVLISGTPCQVAAMKSIAGRFTDNLFLVEVVCHGIPSSKFFKDYISYLNAEKGSVKEYIFSYKRNVLNGMNKYISYTTKKSKTFVKNWPQDSYNSFFMEARNYQECCYSCKFANAERTSDLTLCDYWHWDSVHKKDFPACSTLSGICVNTEQGQTLLQKVLPDLTIVKSSFESLSKHNGCLLKPTPRPLSRDSFMEDWLAKGYAYLDARYRRNNKKRLFKSFLLMLIPEKAKLFFYRLRNEN